MPRRRPAPQAARILARAHGPKRRLEGWRRSNGRWGCERPYPVLHPPAWSPKPSSTSRQRGAFREQILQGLLPVAAACCHGCDSGHESGRNLSRTSGLQQQRRRARSPGSSHQRRSHRVLRGRCLGGKGGWAAAYEEKPGGEPVALVPSRIHHPHPTAPAAWAWTPSPLAWKYQCTSEFGPEAARVPGLRSRRRRRAARREAGLIAVADQASVKHAQPSPPPSAAKAPASITAAIAARGACRQVTAAIGAHCGRARVG